MITLTIAEAVKSVIGANVPASYERIVLSPITFDPQGLLINARVNLISTSSPDQQPIVGTLEINASQGKLKIEIPQIVFLKRITLSAGQISAVQGQINQAQNSVESGLITVSVISGTQSQGV